MWLDDRYWLPVVLGQKKGEGATGADDQNFVVGEFYFKASSGPGSKIMTRHELRAVPSSGLPPLPTW